METAVVSVYRFLCVVGPLLCVLALTDCFRTENCFWNCFDFFADFCFVSLSFYFSSCSFSSAFRWQIQLCYGQRVDRKARVKPLRFLKVPEGSVAVQLHDFHLLIIVKKLVKSHSLFTFSIISKLKRSLTNFYVTQCFA